MKNMWWVLGLLVTAACSSDGGDDTGGVTIAETPLSGQVDGKPWTFVSGATDAFLSADEPTLFTSLYAEAIAKCDGIPFATQPEIIMQLPRQPGTYALSLTRNATFAIARGASDTDNLIATKGKLVIEEVTTTTIKGGAYINYDANNSVNGHFEAMLCPE